MEPMLATQMGDIHQVCVRKFHFLPVAEKPSKPLDCSSVAVLGTEKSPNVVHQTMVSGLGSPIPASKPNFCLAFTVSFYRIAIFSLNVSRHRR